MGRNIIFSHGESNARGVAILASRKCGINLDNPDYDHNGRIVTCDIDWMEIDFSLLRVYLPNSMYPWKKFIQNLNNYLHEGSNWIVTGDFNRQLNLNNTDKRS